MSTTKVLPIQLADYRLILIPGRSSRARSLKIYDECFKTWSDIWSVTLRDLDGLDRLYSDEFTRQDWVCALFKGDFCLGMVCFRGIHPLSWVERQDSWFKPWPQELLTQVADGCQRGMIISYFSVRSDYRRTQASRSFEIDVAKTLTEISTRFCLHSHTDIAFGVTRNNRSVNRLAVYGGAEVVAANRKHHGVDVDLVVFKSASMKTACKKFSSLSEFLWERRMDVGVEEIEYAQNF